MPLLVPLGFYGILTNPAIGYDRLANIMVDEGVACIQLRIKSATREAVVKVAERLRRIVRPPSMLIINDDPLVARQVGADGVHLGQTDTSYVEARRILGSEAVIGLSTHNALQLREACSKFPDYVGIGPVFPTPTKAVADAALGLATMRELVLMSSVPNVVLGGIDLSNIESVVNAGARSVCAVRAVNESTTPASVIRSFQNTLREA